MHAKENSRDVHVCHGATLQEGLVKPAERNNHKQQFEVKQRMSSISLMQHTYNQTIHVKSQARFKQNASSGRANPSKDQKLSTHTVRMQLLKMQHCSFIRKVVVSLI